MYPFKMYPFNKPFEKMDMAGDAGVTILLMASKKMLALCLWFEKYKKKIQVRTVKNKFKTRSRYVV